MEHLLEQYRQIRNGLALLRTVPLEHAVRGRFDVRPPVSEALVSQFENSHGFSFPAEYRGFLIHVANGGAGPHKIAGLGEMVVDSQIMPWDPNWVGDPSIPFPYTEAWNDIDDGPVWEEERLHEPGYEEAFFESMKPFEDEYWHTRHIDGTIPLCDTGCAAQLRLVVNGPEAGNLWEDVRCNLTGLVPCQWPDGSRITFLRWYLKWLNGALFKFGLV